MNNDLKKPQMNSSYFGASNNKPLCYADIEFSDDDDDFEPKRPPPRPVPPLEKINKIRTDIPKLNPINKVRCFPVTMLDPFGGFGSGSNNAGTSKANDTRTSTFPTSSFYNKNDDFVNPRKASLVNGNYDLQSKNKYQELLAKLIPNMYRDESK